MARYAAHRDAGGPPGPEIVAWRRCRLERAGFPAQLADALASDLRIDLHAVLELLDRGCPPALAARILAPLDLRWNRCDTTGCSGVSVSPGRSVRPLPMQPFSEPAAQLDPVSRGWLESLRSDGQARDQAIVQLHALLLRAARFETARRRHTLTHIPRGELDDIAMQSADDALVAVLSKLDGFRGASRFTTWAYKFALLETAVKLRRRPWQEREIPIEPSHWLQHADDKNSPHSGVEQGELLSAVARAIQTGLTPHQREVLIAVALNGIPIDVLAERLGTTRGALYKTIHDARVTLRRRLRADGLETDAAAEEASR